MSADDTVPPGDSPIVPAPVPLTPLAAATEYTRRGYCVVPVPHRSKKPVLDAWQLLRLTEADLPEYFNGRPQNVGILNGEPSGWVADVDLDHPRCVELADEFLPPTPAEFGRPSKRRSHRLFKCTGPFVTRKLKSKSCGMLIELRSTGTQTVAPWSTHESGEPITWEIDGAEPALIDPDVLLAAVIDLANAVKIELGERAAPKPPKAPKESSTTATLSPGKSKRLIVRIQACIAAMLRMNIADYNDGSGRLFAAACRVIEHDLNDENGPSHLPDRSTLPDFPSPKLQSSHRAMWRTAFPLPT